jgi:hypothetical protein
VVIALPIDMQIAPDFHGAFAKRKGLTMNQRKNYLLAISGVAIVTISVGFSGTHITDATPPSLFCRGSRTSMVAGFYRSRRIRSRSSRISVEPIGVKE